MLHGGDYVSPDLQIYSSYSSQTVQFVVSESSVYYHWVACQWDREYGFFMRHNKR